VFLLVLLQALGLILIQVSNIMAITHIFTRARARIPDAQVLPSVVGRQYKNYAARKSSSSDTDTDSVRTEKETQRKKKLDKTYKINILASLYCINPPNRGG